MSTPPESKPSILVVEDDVASGRRLAQLLREDGYPVEVVLDGEAAMARLARAPTPDVMVTDYRLPHADGLEVAAFGRRLHPELRVVMVTSYSEVIARLAPGTAVPPVILPKPLAYNDLTRVLEGIRPSAIEPGRASVPARVR